MTYLEDFANKFPNYLRRCDVFSKEKENNCPYGVCRNYIYHHKLNHCFLKNCKDCWNEEMINNDQTKV